jgi:hypothetical protein
MHATGGCMHASTDACIALQLLIHPVACMHPLHPVACMHRSPALNSLLATCSPVARAVFSRSRPSL